MAAVKAACIVSVQGELVTLLPGDEVPDGVVITNPEVVDQDSKEAGSKAPARGRTAKTSKK